MFLVGTMIFLSISVTFCLFRAILGPRLADRVICVNLVGTKTIIIIAILTFYLKQSALIDIAMVYAMISFLATVVLSKVYLMPHHNLTPLEQAEIDVENEEVDAP